MGSVAVDVLPGVGNVGFKNFLGGHGMAEIPDAQAAPCGSEKRISELSDSEKTSFLENVLELNLTEPLQLLMALAAVYPEELNTVLAQKLNDPSQKVGNNYFPVTTEVDTAELQKQVASLERIKQKIGERVCLR